MTGFLCNKVENERQKEQEKRCVFKHNYYFFVLINPAHKNYFLHSRLTIHHSRFLFRSQTPYRIYNRCFYCLETYCYQCNENCNNTCKRKHPPTDGNPVRK